MPERTHEEKALVFLEILHDLHKREMEMLLPNGFVPPGLLAFAVNEAKNAIWPQYAIHPKQPEDEMQPVPEVNRVAQNFPNEAPDEQGGKEKVETFEIPIELMGAPASPQGGNKF